MKQKIIYTTEIQNQMIEKPFDSSLAKKIIIFFSLILPFFILTFWILKVNLKIYSVGKEIRGLELSLRKLEDERVKLILKKEEILNPEEIEKIATENGLVPVNLNGVIFFYEP